MNAQQMWEQFSSNKNISASYDAWAFGLDADELAGLVNAGVKTATSSAFPLYELEGESLPREGEYSVILNSQDQAVCIIRTERICVIPFCDVTANHAWREGEGDRSLEYWREVHEIFFRREMSDAGLVFTQDIPILCEEFLKVYP